MNTVTNELDLETEAQVIISQLLMAEQLDHLHVSLTNLTEMIERGEIDLILEQPNKSLNQKTLYLQKIIGEIYSPELKDYLENKLAAVKALDDLDFFLQRNLRPILANLQKKAEGIKVVRLTLALDFEEKDLQEMAKILTDKIKQPVVLEVEIDHSLIGGTIIQLGNFISDYSLRTRLNQFRNKWKAAVVDDQIKQDKEAKAKSHPLKAAKQ